MQFLIIYFVVGIFLLLIGLKWAKQERQSCIVVLDEPTQEKIGKFPNQFAEHINILLCKKKIKK